MLFWIEITVLLTIFGALCMLAGAMACAYGIDRRIAKKYDITFKQAHRFMQHLLNPD